MLLYMIETHDRNKYRIYNKDGWNTQNHVATEDWEWNNELFEVTRVLSIQHRIMLVDYGTSKLASQYIVLKKYF